MNIGRILNSILAQERTGKAEEEREQERYARIVIPLDKTEFVGTDIELHLKGDYIGRIKYDGSPTGCYFRLNNRHSGRIYAGEFRRTYIEYDRVYLTNPSSQTGKELILTVGEAFSSEIEPSSGSWTGIPYQKSMTTSDSQGVFEASTKKLRSVVIHNTHGSYAALVGLTTPIFTIGAGESLALDNVDMHLLYVKTKSGTNHATLELIGTEEV